MRALASSSSGRVTGFRFCAKPACCQVRWFAIVRCGSYVTWLLLASRLMTRHSHTVVRRVRFSDSKGRVVPEANPNASMEHIDSICNGERNVFGLMPHPDRASDARLGSIDGAKIFRSMVQTISANGATERSEHVKRVA